ncbi:MULTISPECIES: DoxX family protein [unclassified Spirosoma]|mgnify:CR=1 FL=1|uniref:DoxX family protein n=1 Tax=unclassified Spirosoma TaxID=2621999 RepID=UPI0009635BDE|nr:MULTISPECIES: DoxX family protein [unclassified Spirosoma]MBN8826874.1 DoxX family protein [Spirosoma sp.]OJW75553.1 MAG: DoxX family protein [Spirosoma sp. 48-14]
MQKLPLYLLWAARLGAATILLQTLYFKFGAEAESVYIFSRLGVEPWGRIGSGVIELIASILILIPRTSWIGAGIGLGVMAGAILAHLTVLGIDILGDGGYLFFLGVVVAISCIVILALTRQQWLPIVQGLTGRSRVA